MKNQVRLANDVYAETANGDTIIISPHIKIVLNKDGTLKSMETFNEENSPMYEGVAGQPIEEDNFAKVSLLLQRMGMPTNFRGYKYVRAAVLLALDDPSYLEQITGKLYPTLGERFGVTKGSVERCMRHAIKVTCEKGNVDFITEIVPCPIAEVTNSLFISAIVDRITIGMI